MRKKVIKGEAGESAEASQEKWLDVESLAQVEITSEDPSFPIENALLVNGVSKSGWRALGTGPQTIRIQFDNPVKVRCIRLRFTETQQEREQEFLLSYRQKEGSKREIVRQQWTLSPSGSTEEIEKYLVELDEVVRLELTIDPDRGRDRYPATLAEWRIA